jgi:glycosyltransferase involved in cell wall biosynthesis
MRSHLLAFLSVNEGFGRVPLEAMASGSCRHRLQREPAPTIA